MGATGAMVAWLLLGRLAFAADGEGTSAGTSTLQEIHELEWDRAAPRQFVPLLAGATPAERVDLALALGRLRNREALEQLSSMRSDPFEEVQRAVAQALAWTPGSRSTIRSWLGEQPLPEPTLYGRERAKDSVLVALLESLGSQGESQDVPYLVDLLEEPWPVGGAAARALGRMGNRRVPSIETALVPLSRRLDATDPRMVADVAWAMARIGLDRLSGAELRQVTSAAVDRLTASTYETARAWLVRAVWGKLDRQTRDELFFDLATDPSRLVKVTLLAALKPEDAGADVLGGWLADPDPWVRIATIEALGREGSDKARELLSRHASEARDDYERAAAIRAGGTAEISPEASAVLRAAVLEGQPSPEQWLQAALKDEAAVVRSAGAGSLVEETTTPWTVGEQLLAAQDAAIREAALELIKRAPAKKRAEILLVHLRVETDPDVLAAGLRGLAEVAREIDPKDPTVDAIFKRVTFASEPQVRHAANRALSALGLPALPERDSREGTRQLVLPSGEVVEVAAGRPALGSVSRIRGARVETSEGTFYIELDPETAPLAVWNFAELAEAHFYDGLVFHRVIPGFVAQTGCPRGDGWGGAGYTLPDEVSALPYDAGAVGMARSDRDTGSSQWFITTAPQPHLVGEYTRFGTVVQGLHVVKRLSPGSQLLRITIERVATERGSPE